YSWVMTCVRASRAHGSLGFFSASSRSLSGSGATRAAACFRCSSVVAFQFAFAASPNSLRIALYCSAGATGLSWVAAIHRPRARTRVLPMMRSSEYLRAARCCAFLPVILPGGRAHTPAPRQLHPSLPVPSRHLAPDPSLLPHLGRQLLVLGEQARHL